MRPHPGLMVRDGAHAPPHHEEQSVDLGCGFRRAECAL